MSITYSLKEFTMLGQQINTLLNDKLQQEQNEIQRLQEEKDLKTLREIENVRSLFNSIKIFTRKIANGQKKLENDQAGNVFITTSKEVFGKNYCRKLTTNASKKDLIELLEETKLPLLEVIQDIKQWLADNDIKGIQVRYEYDSGGIESWNSYWIKI